MGKSKSPGRRPLESSALSVPYGTLKMGPNGMTGGHRPPDTDDKLLLSIASKQSTLVQQMITLTCYIPSSSVGAVIGRRGATIAQIQKQAQQIGTSNGAVRLSIVGHHNEIAAAAAAAALEDSTLLQQQQQQPLSPQASSPERSPVQTQNMASTPLQAASSSVPYTYTELDWSSPLWTPVVIRADPCATLTAAQLLREKVGRMDDVIMDIPLGRNKHSGLIGRRGFVLANLSADTNVRIMVPSRELRHDIVQLEGDLDNVKQCLERVLVITSDIPGSKKKAATTNNSNANESTNAARQQGKKDDTGETEIVTVSVLPPQAKLRTVGRRTDTSIKKKKVDDNNWDIIVHGPTAECVKAAVATLHKWNEENSNNITSGTDKGEAAKTGGSATPSRPRGGRGRPQGRNNNNNNNKAKDKNSKQKAAKSGESPA